MQMTLTQYVDSRRLIRAIDYQSGHVWFGVRVDGGGRGRGKGEKTPDRGDCWKAKHPLSSCVSLYLRRWAGKWVKLKTGNIVLQQKQTQVEPMSETVRQLFSARKEMAATKSPPRSQIWVDMFYMKYSKRGSLSITVVHLFDDFFFQMIVNDTLNHK